MRIVTELVIHGIIERCLENTAKKGYNCLNLSLKFIAYLLKLIQLAFWISGVTSIYCVTYPNGLIVKNVFNVDFHFSARMTKIQCRITLFMVEKYKRK